MSRWLASGEPVVRVIVRLPRVKSKDERLRERAEAHARLSLEKRYAAGKNNYSENELELRTRTLLAEREAVLKKMSGIRKRRVRLRRLVFAQLLENHRIDKWW